MSTLFKWLHYYTALIFSKLIYKGFFFSYLSPCYVTMESSISSTFQNQAIQGSLLLYYFITYLPANETGATVDLCM